MRKTLLSFVLLVLGLHFSLLGQTTLHTLFVNDNSVFQANTDTILSALNATGLDYDYFDARDSLRSPTAEELDAYDLVIWYCSTDGVGNYFWSGNDADNADLMGYLETGGMLWVMGNDFLYDRYAAPVIFTEGDFVYDYLGLWEYHAQSYGDDGGLGVERLDLKLSTLTSVQSVYWIYPTAWWIDACVPVPSAVSVYEMAPDNYSLAGYSSAIMNTTLNCATLSFFFDPALMDNSGNRIMLFSDVIDYFTLHAAVADHKPAVSGLSVFPNPFTNHVLIELPGEFQGSEAELQIMDISGHTILKKTAVTNKTEQLNLETLSPGVYILKITGPQGSRSRSLVK